MGIHNYERQYKRAVEKLKDDKFLEANKKHIFAFIDDCALENLSISLVALALTCGMVSAALAQPGSAGMTGTSRACHRDDGAKPSRRRP